MLKRTKYIYPFLAGLALSGCDQNVTATLYTSDIQGMIETHGKSVPVDITIEVLESGIDKQCAKPEGKMIVDAVASVFESASLIGCEDISGSINDRMLIKARTVLDAPASPEVEPGKFLLHFSTFKEDKSHFIVARFNAEAYSALQQQLQKMNMMARPKFEDASMTITIENDMREPAAIYTSTGLFVDGVPADQNVEAKLASRQKMTIKLGDVKQSFLGKNGWAGIANIGHSPSSN
ncbi:hypothetical protein [Agrobacterium sp. FDAARGOS_525]|nr:hypothetical protein [Agrobacterium sp. FDAARGOS_525]